MGPTTTTSPTLKNHLVATIGEFVGTFLFLFIAFAGTQTAFDGSPKLSTDAGPELTQLLYIALTFGFSLAVNVWLFFRISGGLFNPAVTLALCLLGIVPPIRSILIFLAEIIGAIAAAGLVKGLFPGDAVYFNIQLVNNTSIAQGLFIEMFLTAQLVFAMIMLAVERTKSTFLAPVGVGLALFVVMLVGTNYTGAGVNPARAFAPSVVKPGFPGYHWIYWVGPLLGTLLAVGFYKLMKFLEFEELAGDQDKSGAEMA